MKTDLSLQATVQFTAKNQQGPAGFEILAYSGAVVERPWGRVCIDVRGISAKQQIPVLLLHDHAKIVGHSQSVYVDVPNLYVKGIFSGSSKTSQEVRELAGENFPWQASIGVSPLKSYDIQVGKTATVNGRDVSGPCEVWSKSQVYEVSFVPLGADPNTSVTTFDRQQAQQEEPLRLAWQRMTDAERGEFIDFDNFKAYAGNDGVTKIKNSSRVKSPAPILLTPEGLRAEWDTLTAEEKGEFIDFDNFKAYHLPMSGICIKNQ